MYRPTKESFDDVTCNPFIQPSNYALTSTSSSTFPRCYDQTFTYDEKPNESNGFDFIPVDNKDRTSHFGYGSTLDWYLRSGKPSGKVVLQDGVVGNVGIGGSVNPTTKLDVTGDVHVNGVLKSQTMALGSSASLENIVTLQPNVYLKNVNDDILLHAKEKIIMNNQERIQLSSPVVSLPSIQQNKINIDGTALTLSSPMGLSEDDFRISSQQVVFQSPKVTIDKGIYSTLKVNNPTNSSSSTDITFPSCTTYKTAKTPMQQVYPIIRRRLRWRGIYPYYDFEYARTPITFTDLSIPQLSCPQNSFLNQMNFKIKNNKGYYQYKCCDIRK